MLDAVLPLKSMLTKGLSLVARIPFKCDLEALMISALTSSRLNSFLAQKVKSNIDTLLTGTLVAIPVSFPFSSGIIQPIALAAPVLVGINDRNDDLARYGSE